MQDTIGRLSLEPVPRADSPDEFLHDGRRHERREHDREERVRVGDAEGGEHGAHHECRADGNQELAPEMTRARPPPRGRGFPSLL